MSPDDAVQIFDPELGDHLLIPNRSAARAVKLSVPTMQRLRTHGSGPPFIRISGKIFYRVADLRKWIRDQEAQSTAQARAIRDEASLMARKPKATS